MSKYNEQHATTMLNVLQGTETLKRFKEKIRSETIAEFVEHITLPIVSEDQIEDIVEQLKRGE